MKHALVIVTVGLAILGMSGCGSSGPSNQTPLGISSFNITATATALAGSGNSDQTQQISLNINVVQ